MKILFLPRTPVDFEHMLPYINLFKEKLSKTQVHFCCLDTHTNLLEHQVLKDWCPSHHEISPSKFVRNPFVRWLLSFIFFFQRLSQKIFNETLQLKGTGFRRSIFSSLWNYIYALDTRANKSDYDVILVSENNAASILTKKDYPIFHHLVDIDCTTLLIPESYDALQWQSGFDNYKEARKSCDFKRTLLLARGGIGEKLQDFPSKQILRVGIPRYSSWWCNILNEHYKKHQGIKKDRESNILYLAQKKKAWDPEFGLLIEKIDQDFFNFIKDHPHLKLIIKPHPKGNHYNNQYIPNAIKDRVTVITKTPTTALLNSCGIVITNWTTIIPHFLWLSPNVCTYQVEKYEQLQNLNRNIKVSLKGLITNLSSFDDFKRQEQNTIPSHISESLSHFFQCNFKDKEYLDHLIKILITNLAIKNNFLKTVKCEYYESTRTTKK